MAAATSVFAGLAQDSSVTGGALRGKVGPMAKVPVSDLPSFNYGSTSVLRNEAQDGGIGGIGLFCSAAGLPNGAATGIAFRATSVGLRTKRSTATTQPPVDFIVDGRCVEAFRSTQAQINGVVTAGWTDNEASFEWPYLLKRVDHWAIARIDANPDGATVNTTTIMGWLLPRADGFRDVASTPRKGYLTSATAPTAAGTTFNVTSDQATIELKVFNVDATAYEVYIYRENGTTLFDHFTVPASTTGSVGGTAGQTIPGIGKYTFAAPINLLQWVWKTSVAPTTALTAQMRTV